MQTWKLVLEYDGAAFSGWQRQPGVTTAQEVVEEAVRRFFGGELIHCHASGRTDAGVHALGQVVSFRATAEREAAKLRMALNTMLPKAVSCISAEKAPADFHARLSAVGKRYRYVILARQDRSPFWWGRALYVRRPMDWGAVERALPDFIGTADCSAFRGPNCEERNPVRTIREATHREVEPGIHWIEFEGPGFLRYQVRIMVGTLMEIGEGRRPADDIPRIRSTKNREQAGRTALPDGLYLVSVQYPG